MTMRNGCSAAGGSRASVRWLRIDLPPAHLTCRRPRCAGGTSLDADMPVVARDLAEREAERRAACAVPKDDASIRLQRGRAR